MGHISSTTRNTNDSSLPSFNNSLSEDDVSAPLKRHEFRLKRKSRFSRRDKNDRQMNDRSVYSAKSATTSSPGSSFSGSDTFSIDYNALKFVRQIGEGAFADVWEGEWLHSPVAIKKFRLDLASACTSMSTTTMSTSSDSDDPRRLSRISSISVLRHFASSRSIDKYVKFRKEVSTMASLRHPNLVLYMGACGDPTTPLCIVSELFSGGSLYTHLHERGEQVPLAHKLSFAIEIARGMHYLHSREPAILHRDLKSRNILLKERTGNAAPHVVICDFGLCRLFEDECDQGGLKKAMSKPGEDGGAMGTVAYMAPNVIEGGNFHVKDDVYSYGVLLWEIFAQRVPYTDMQPIQIMFAVTTDDLRPEIDEQLGVPHEVQDLFRRCWSRDRESRPVFDEIISTLCKVNI